VVQSFAGCGSLWKTVNMRTASLVHRLTVVLAASSKALGLAVDETWARPPSKILQWHAASDGVAPVVDLDYARYQGYHNPTFDLNIYRGYVHQFVIWLVIDLASVRFAAPPKRWQLPEPPTVNRTAVIQATKDPPRCPQSGPGPL
jgi:hypothetical protein